MLKRLFQLMVLVVLLLAGGLYFYASTALKLSNLPIEFSISPGMSLKSAAENLAREGVLDSPLPFVVLGRALGKAGQIKAGSYVLEQRLSPLELLEKITVGDTLLGKVTIIEGWTFRQMRQAQDAHPRLRHDSQSMTDSEILAAIGASERHPEGLFFPDTYFFDVDSSDLGVLRRAYHAMQEQLARVWAEREPGLPYRNPYEVLIMASIIEKETGAPEERPLIASVFINRLRIGMRLQTDPTVIYGLGARFDGNLRKVDLITDTPYNTYTRAGLTPTPIALPGTAALQAAVRPETSKYLYFVAKGEGRHQFSRSLDEHNRAVNRYQRGGR
jgi:UPF0755 protein